MKGPSGDPGAKPPKALVFFNAKATFLTQTRPRHKIVNIDLGRFSTLRDSNNCERSEQTDRLREAFTGVQGLAPWRGLQGGSTPLRKNILYFAS